MTGGSRFVKTLFLLFILTFATLLVFYAYMYVVNLWGILCSAQIQDKHPFAGKRYQYINKWKFLYYPICYSRVTTASHWIALNQEVNMGDIEEEMKVCPKEWRERNKIQKDWRGGGAEQKSLNAHTKLSLIHKHG